MGTKYYLGIDAGGTKLSGAVFSEGGDCLFTKRKMLEARQGKAVSDLMMVLVRECLEEAASRSLTVDSLGVCIPGIAYKKTGRVWAPNIPGWDNYPLLDDLEKLFPSFSRIAIDSDRACSILGETWQGAAKNCENALFVAVGTGIGLGILMDGHIMRGHGDIAGATGWMALDRPYHPKYDACGCFEYYASGDGIARTARETLQEFPDYPGTLDISSLRAEDVFAAYEKNDPAAVRTFEKVIEFWGMAVANYVSLFNPEKIIFGGGVFGPAERFLPEIQKEAEKWAQPVAIRQVDCVISSLNTLAGLYGAGRLAMINNMKG